MKNSVTTVLLWAALSSVPHLPSTEGSEGGVVPAMHQINFEWPKIRSRVLREKEKQIMSNQTTRDVRRTNRDNMDDNLTIFGGSQTFTDSWVGLTNKPTEITWESDNLLIIKLWDDDWKLHYSTPVTHGSVAVGRKLDFGITIKDTVVTIYEKNDRQFDGSTHFSKKVDTVFGNFFSKKLDNHVLESRKFDMPWK
eukprot:scaffold56990_cov62-Attheya_sp.AAC.1